ncbi:MAG: zinc-ribbon domain-containing protein [Deltaproteobacteria bacterium]|nr:zinc-ribbon domain-containing protein [Candidatus Zymogenaceae bacterium]
MKTQCPKCGYEGDIKDDLIPEGGRTVGCPQCKATFIVERGNTERKADTNSSASPEVEVDGRDFIPYRHRETRATRQRADRPVSRIVVLALSFSAVFVIGLFIGRYTHNYSLTNPLKQKEVTPAVLMTPTSPADDRAEIPAPPDVTASPVETLDADTAQPSEPLILEESFTSDVFLDITEIDGKLKEATEITGLQRELELKEFAGSLVGKMLVGYFVVRDVGKLNSPYAKILPLTLYNYYLEAEGDSADPVKSVVYVGLKEADELSSSLDKGSTVYIQGFIYSCTLVFDHFEMGIVNPKVELSR